VITNKNLERGGCRYVNWLTLLRVKALNINQSQELEEKDSLQTSLPNECRALLEVLYTL